ncbi:MAG: flagellar biosynthetic protein FliR [Candidatus Competibacteraceae bacterium]|nr:flagellar biosynthetic protein FliR [Candidatus Competibacteraceae bacterium]
MELSAAEIAVWVGSFLWPLTRIGAMALVAPVLSARGLPRRVRLVVVVVLTWAVVPVIPLAPAIEPISPLGLLITVQQLLIGLAMGFILRLALAALEIGGQVIAMQMGLAFANLMDPQGSGQMPLLGHFYYLFGTLIFLSLDGHLLLMRLLVDSFTTLPIGPEGLVPDDLWLLVSWGSRMFAGAVLLGLPAIASLLLVNMAFGVLTRAAPQLNIFAVGFPITLMLGLVILLYSMPALLPQLQQLLDGAFLTLGRILAA